MNNDMNACMGMMNMMQNMQTMGSRTNGGMMRSGMCGMMSGEQNSAAPQH